MKCKKCDVRNLENRFILCIPECNALKTAIVKNMEKVRELVPKDPVNPGEEEEFLKKEFQRTHGPQQSHKPSDVLHKLLVEALVRQKICHLLFFQEWHFLGKRKFSQEIFLIFKCECFEALGFSFACELIS
jgi:hypothetical protein